MKAVCNGMQFFLAVSVFSMLILAGCSGPGEKKQAFFEKGKHLFEQKDFVKAKLEFKNAVQIDPEFAQAYFMLARTYLALKDFRRAFTALSKSVELAPDNINARIVFGKLCLAGKSPDRAEAQADAVLAQDSANIDAKLLKASVCFAQKHMDKGRKILLDMYSSGVTSPDMFMMLALAEKSEKNIDNACKYYEEGIEHNRASIPLLLGLAGIEAGRRNFKKAESCLEQVVKLQPDNPVFRFYLADILFASGRKDRAENVLDSLLEKDGPMGKIKLGIAKFWISRGQVARAEKIIAKGLETCPDNFEFYRVMAEIYVNTRRFDRAESVLRRAVKLDPDPDAPDTLRAETALARVLVLKGSTDEGEKLVDTVLKHDPKNVDAHFLKGRIYLAKHNGSDAVSEFRIVTQERPGLAAGYFELARAHAMNREFSLAADVLRRARTRLPDEKRFLPALARINIMNRDLDAACANMLEAVKQDPRNRAAWMLLGSIYENQGNLARAAEIYEQAFEKNPDLWGAANNYAFIVSEISDSESELQHAMDFAGRAAALEPDNPVILDTIGWLHYRTGDLDAAFENVSKALDRLPDDSGINYHLGMILDRQGKIREARLHFEKALASGTDFQGAETAGKKLESYKRSDR